MLLLIFEQTEPFSLSLQDIMTFYTSIKDVCESTFGIDVSEDQLMIGTNKRDSEYVKLRLLLKYIETPNSFRHMNKSNADKHESLKNRLANVANGYKWKLLGHVEDTPQASAIPLNLISFPKVEDYLIRYES